MKLFYLLISVKSGDNFPLKRHSSLSKILNQLVFWWENYIN